MKIHAKPKQTNETTTEKKVFDSRETATHASVGEIVRASPLRSRTAVHRRTALHFVRA